MRLVTVFGGASRTRRRLRTGTLVAAGAGLLYLLLTVITDPLEGVQNAFGDQLFREQASNPNIVIVAIDEPALDELGRLRDWPRSLHATAVDRLSEAGASVIAYDLLFADRGDEDEAFAGAIARAGNVVLVASGDSIREADRGEPYVYGGVDPPAQSLAGAAAALAHPNIEQSSGDAKVRRVPLLIRDSEGSGYLALSLVAFYLHFGLPPIDAASFPEDELVAHQRTVPLEEHRTMRINYVGHVGRSDRFPVIPFLDVLNGEFDADQVARKIVLVGVMAPAADRHTAPLLGDSAGVEIHANSLDTLLEKDFLHPAPGWVSLVVGLAFVGGAALALPRWRLGYSAGLVIALAVGTVFAGVTLFYRNNWMIDIVDPLAALAVATVAGLGARVVAGRAAEGEIRELFGRYVSDDVARELVHRSDRGELALGGELREVTALFGDIRGFTTMSQGMEPAELVDVLNRRFEVIVRSVEEHGGIVNKFLGDAIMAIWNAPREQPDHALLACRAALRAHEELAELRVSGPAPQFGFGVNTGPALAGNVGAHGRLEYTVIGETVNTASRLSGVAGGGETWVGERTRELVAGIMEFESLPPQQLKGMAAPVAAYRLIGEAPRSLADARKDEIEELVP